MNVNIKDLQQSINEAVAAKAKANQRLLELHAIAIDLGYIIEDGSYKLKMISSINN